jgi:hypothetical protein
VRVYAYGCIIEHYSNTLKGLWTVTLFKRVVEDFKNSSRYYLPTFLFCVCIYISLQREEIYGERV